MRGVVGGVAFLLAAATACSAEDAASQPGEAAAPTFMFLSGLDLWRSGAFAHGGVLWSPRGVEHEGFTLKLLAGSGTYQYRSSALGEAEVTGAQVLGALMPGWRFKVGALEVTALAGLDVQHHWLMPDDSENRLHGLQIGLRAGTDLWYQPLPAMMLAANVSVSSIGPSYWSRVAAGWRMFEHLART